MRVLLTIGLGAALVATPGCVTSGGGGGGGSTAKTCDAVCPRVIDCWTREAGEEALLSGYRGDVRYIDDNYLGDFERARHAYGDCGDYGYDACSIEDIKTVAVEKCLQGCYGDLEDNAGMIACIAEQSCPTMLSICLGADFNYGY